MQSVLVGSLCRALGVAVIVLVAGCGADAVPPAASRVGPTPTVSAVFSPAQTPRPMRSTTIDVPSPWPASATPGPHQDPRIVEIPIYTGTLDRNWTAEHSWGVTYSLAEQHYTRDGTATIAVTPNRDYGAVFFSVRPQATAVYTRAQVLGVSIWLSGGEQSIPNDALAMTVFGSNQYPYWVKGDDSVKITGRVTDDSPLFSETRLYYLGINQTIPPKKWVEVINWLDDRQYDPNYTYVTGIYLKNSVGFWQTFYIDRVSLLVQRIP